MSTLTITISRDDAQALSVFAEAMLDDVPAAQARPIVRAIKALDAAIHQHDAEADMVARAEADLIARADANAIDYRVHIQITKPITFKGGSRLRKGLVLAAQRDGRDGFYVVLDRTPSGGSSGLSVPATHAKELAL